MLMLDNHKNFNCTMCCEHTTWAAGSACGRLLGSSSLFEV